MPTLSDDWHPRDERDARIEELEEENERLRAATRYRNTHDVRASRIDAALALLEGDDHYMMVERAVKALKGGE